MFSTPWDDKKGLQKVGFEWLPERNEEKLHCRCNNGGIQH